MTCEPLTKEMGDRLWAAAEKAAADRAEAMPTDDDAISAMHTAFIRLTELGWRHISYCPKDGSIFDAIEAGSAGIFDCWYDGEWPDGTWWLFDQDDMWPARPVLFREKQTSEKETTGE